MLKPPKTDEATFTITGRIRIYVFLTVITTILGIGALTANVAVMKEKVNRLEQLSYTNVEDHSKILGSLISIQESSKYLKERIDELRIQGAK